jgi:hypothetical protein
MKWAKTIIVNKKMTSPASSSLVGQKQRRYACTVLIKLLERKSLLNSLAMFIYMRM